MQEHLVARCGPYRMMFTSDNLEGIVPLPEGVRLRRSGRRAPRTALDLRAYLGTQAADRGVRLGWHSSDGDRVLDLVVDAVESIVRCGPADLAPLPLMPPRLRALCDGVRTGDDDGLCLRVRPDVALPMAEPAERRRFLAALRVAEVGP